MSDTVRCPRCKRQQQRRLSDSIYRCDKCHAMFDDDPDEGGDWSNRNPALRIEREERFAETKTRSNVRR